MNNISKEMLQTYYSNRLADLVELQKDLDGGSVEVFHLIGHQVSGSAGSFGFLKLEPIALEMEDLLQTDLKAQGQGLINRFRDCLSIYTSKFDLK
jgi:HPt (histidine-containing phosphotransfer) domain-containing protein